MDFGQQYAAVALVMFLLGSALWWLRRRGIASPGRSRGGGRRRMEALERLSLGPQHSLHLVRIGRKVAVVSCSPGGCALLARAPAERSGGGAR